eukprot:1992397-Pyramimonas_sp.AAC.1
MEERRGCHAVEGGSVLSDATAHCCSSFALLRIRNLRSFRPAAPSLRRAARSRVACAARLAVPRAACWRRGHAPRWRP